MHTENYKTHLAILTLMLEVRKFYVLLRQHILRKEYNFWDTLYDYLTKAVQKIIIRDYLYAYYFDMSCTEKSVLWTCADTSMIAVQTLFLSSMNFYAIYIFMSNEFWPATGTLLV